MAFVAATSRAATSGALLPAGYLTTAGSQITDLKGHRVRFACVGYEPGASANIAADVQGMAADGFNCLRYPWYDATLVANLAVADRIVAAAGAVGLKVILDHHGDETPGPGNNWLPYPCNGLPFDQGPGTNGTDGCGDIGTVTEARFVQDWVTVAQHYAGNPTVVGFDLTNEPHINPSWYALNPGGAGWNTGTSTDLRAIYIQAGNAIQAVDPNVLIIVEGILNFTSRLLNGGVNAIAGYPDLTLAGSAPVTLDRPNQVVYSIHDYPTPIGGTSPDYGTAKVKAMNAAWGYLVSGQIAPVWVGEMGASLDGIGPDSLGALTATGTKLVDEQNWANTMVAYLNGADGALGGPTFQGCDVGIGTNWWAWGNLNGQPPDGTLTNSGTVRSQQQSVYAKLRFAPAHGC